METNVILEGNCLETLSRLPDNSVHVCITSPPYWGLRDYGHDNQLGLESTPEEYVQNLVEVFREVRRVLRDDGTLWLNLGDSYAGSGKGPSGNIGKDTDAGEARHLEHKHSAIVPNGLKPKDLVGIPWMVAFALRKDGWYLRQDIIWNKPSVMPESVQDRCTKSHEYIFLFSKSQKYYFDNESIKEPATSTDNSLRNRDITKLNNTPGRTRMGGLTTNHYETRNKRSVWTIPTKPFKGAHFATYPPALIEPCILAGSPEDGIVLDPFFGAGTTGLVALENNRQYIGCEINPEYIEIAKERLKPVVNSIENEKISASIVNEYFTF